MTAPLPITSEAKFTPGPWRPHWDIRNQRTKVGDWSFSHWDLRSVRFLGVTEDNVTGRANAHLIAAAPTMAGYIKRKADEGDSEAVAIWETIILKDAVDAVRPVVIVKSVNERLAKRTPDLDDPIWGVAAIGRCIGLPTSKAFYKLQKGYLPGKKIGRIWTSTRRQLQRRIDGGAS